MIGAPVDALRRVLLQKVWFVEEDEDAAFAVVLTHKLGHETLVEFW